MGGADEGGSDSLPVLVVYEKTRRVLHAHTVPAKGVQAVVLKQLARDLTGMGLKRAVYKSIKSPPSLPSWMSSASSGTASWYQRRRRWASPTATALRRAPSKPTKD